MMKLLSELKPGDKVNILVNGRFVDKATVAAVNINSIKLANGQRFNKKTGENITGPSPLTGAIESIESVE